MVFEFSRKSLRLSLAAAALALAATGATASTVTLDRQVPGDTFAGTGNANVTVSVPFQSQNISARAGGFHLVADGVRNLVMWCLDLAHVLTLPSPYRETGTPYANTTGTLSETALGNVQRLFDTSYRGLDFTSNAQMAGFQLALWEIVTETGSSDLDVTTGNFQWVSGSTGARDAANGFLAAMDGPVTQRYRLSFFESEKNKKGKQISQNLVTATPIPLPAALWLLLGSLAGLTLLTRRRTA